jgi:thioredoxin-dependent peroxiredoxin
VELRVEVGDQMPSVGLRASDGYLLNLRTFVTKQPAALLFFGAPTMDAAARRRGAQAAKALAEGHQRLTDAGIAVVGVSCDSERQQTEYIASAKLPYLLFSDERRTAVEMLGIPTVAKGDNVNVARPLVIGVDADGTIRVILAEAKPETLVDEVMRAFAAPVPSEAPASS